MPAARVKPGGGGAAESVGSHVSGSDGVLRKESGQATGKWGGGASTFCRFPGREPGVFQEGPHALFKAGRRRWRSERGEAISFLSYFSVETPRNVTCVFKTDSFADNLAGGPPPRRGTLGARTPPARPADEDPSSGRCSDSPDVPCRGLGSGQADRHGSRDVGSVSGVLLCVAPGAPGGGFVCL